MLIVNWLLAKKAESVGYRPSPLNENFNLLVWIYILDRQRDKRINPLYSESENRKPTLFHDDFGRKHQYFKI
jgi:hypothetical protein